MSEASGTSERLIAARGLTAVLRKGLTLDQFEARLSESGLTPLARELLYGACRHYGALARIANSLLDRPLRGKDQEVLSLLAIGIYQLLALRTPDHAAVGSTVGAARKLRQPWAAGLINACLRRLQQSPRSLTSSPEDLPETLRQALTKEFGESAQQVARSLLERAPMALRVNTARVERSELQQHLAVAGIDAEPGPAAASLILSEPIPTRSLPRYDAGEVSVQDAGAALVVDLVRTLRPDLAGKRLLDACAAPGGKLFALIEANPGLAQALALESSESRLATLKAEAERLDLHQRPQLELRQGDATTRDWWDGEPFDLILIDAPCSGSGTLRRHPDIQWLRRFDTLRDDQSVQDALLGNLAPLLKPGGLLVYATCSLFRAENDARVDALLQREPGLRPAPITLNTGHQTEHGWQLLPTDPHTDGFYYAAIEHLQ